MVDVLHSKTVTLMDKIERKVSERDGVPVMYIVTEHAVVFVPFEASVHAVETTIDWEGVVTVNMFRDGVNINSEKVKVHEIIMLDELNESVLNWL